MSEDFRKRAQSVLNARAKEEERQKECELLCVEIGKALKFSTKPRVPSWRSTPADANFLDAAMTKQGFVVRASESDKRKGITMKVTIPREALPKLVSLMLLHHPPLT
jgi:hypothetical protein